MILLTEGPAIPSGPGGAVPAGVVVDAEFAPEVGHSYTVTVVVYVGPFPDGAGELEEGSAELVGENDVDGAKELELGVELKEKDWADVMLCDAVRDTEHDDSDEDEDCEEDDD